MLISLLLIGAIMTQIASQEKAELFRPDEVFSILKTIRPSLPIEYHPKYDKDSAMQGRSQIILNGIQFYTPAMRGISLSDIEARLSKLDAWSKHGNSYLTHGCDRCKCGCKYWVNDTCVSCGFEFSITAHHKGIIQVNEHDDGRLTSEVIAAEEEKHQAGVITPIETNRNHWEVGMLVEATEQITEEGFVVPDRVHIHANPGDYGKVEYVAEDNIPMVRFLLSGTASDVGHHQIKSVWLPFEGGDLE